MPYNRFTFSEAKGRLQLQTDETVDLFPAVAEVKISKFLAQFLEENVPLALAVNTEKSKSEIIIAPILLELRKLAEHPISIFSGVAFNVDKEKGLTGTCDFIISRSSEQYFISAPVLTVVEAKKDNIHNGLGQCIAEMFAARLFNEREKNVVSSVYGAVTTGSAWKFLKLVDGTVYIDLKEYHISNVGKILGILLSTVQG